MRIWALIAAAMLLLGACNGAPPEIMATDARLAVRVDPVSGAVYESLRLFVAIDDPDGADDAALILVEHEAAELSWEIGREEWIRVDYAGDPWYGVAEILAPEGESLPRGGYRLTVEDEALTRVESRFFVTAPAVPDELVYPRLSGERGSFVVDYVGPVVVRAYSRAGQLRVAEVVRPGRLDEGVQSRIPDEPGLHIYVETIDEPVNIIVGPYRR